MVAWAQGNSDLRQYNGNYHAFGVMGACQHGYRLFGGGAGAEGLVGKGVSLGADVSYQSFAGGGGFNMITGQFGYHFVDRSKPLRWDPFVTLGAGGAFASEGGGSATVNFGGGFNYWFKPRIALRAEFRAHALAQAEEVLASARIGLSFR
jgi:hypothetical protein